MRKFILLTYILFLPVCTFATDIWKIIPTSTQFRCGELLGNHVFLLSGNTLYTVIADSDEIESTIDKQHGLNGTIVFDIIASESAGRLAVIYTDGNIDFIDTDGRITNLPDYTNKVIVGDRTITSVSERDGRLYISTGFGFIIVDILKAEFIDTLFYPISDYLDGTYGHRSRTITSEQLNQYNNLIEINGAASSSNAALAFSDGLLLTSNVDSDSRGSVYATDGILSIYDTYQDEWSNIFNYDVNPLIPSQTAFFFGTTSLSIDPNDNSHYFVGSFAHGLFEFRNKTLVNSFNAFNNEGINSILPDSYTSRIGSIVNDNDGYTWFTNCGVERPLRCITPSGSIISYPLNGYARYNNALDRLLISHHDPYHFKWIVGVRPWEKCQAAMYYDAGTPEDLSDDECISFNSLKDQDGNIYTPQYFNDIAEDYNGSIWLLTTSGPFVIDSPIETYRTPGKVRRIKIPRNDGSNLADYLLAGVDCSCILVDAANRKWIGTHDAGLYLLSADGLTQINHFTSNNSPLLSDNILALAYDDATGTIYISCEGGLLSYSSDAIAGADNYNNVICYPNPVRPEHSGPIHITGLKDQTRVRICDITNTVVYSTVSNGGSVTWDLVGKSGTRINAGVYIVYGTDANGKNGMVTKFLVVN